MKVRTLLLGPACVLALLAGIALAEAEPPRKTGFERPVGDSETGKGAFTASSARPLHVDLDSTALRIAASPITVQAWFRTNEARGKIFECGAQNRDPGPQAGYALYMKWGRLRFGVNNAVEKYGQEVWDDVTTEATYNDGQWHHATGVFPADGKTRVRLYVDGVEAKKVRRAGRAQPALSAYTPTDPVARIAGQTDRIDYPHPRRYFWTGGLADVRVWRRALGTDEIAAGPGAAVKSDATGLVAAWSLKGGPFVEGGAVRDVTGRCDGALARFVYKPPVDDPFFPVDPLVFPEDDFDYGAYPSNITGYTGQDLQRIGVVAWQSATRVRVGERGYYKAGIARRPDGALVIAVCCRHPDYDRDTGNRYFELHVFESADRGRTWKRIDRAALIGKEPSLAALPDGALVLTAQNADSRPDAPKRRMNMYRSQDGGRTWERIAVATGAAPYPYPRNILVDADGSLVFLYAHGTDIALRRSTDGGRTWATTIGEVKWNPRDMDPTTLFAEIGTLRTRDGRLLAALRREIPDTSGEGFEDTFLTESTDNGRSWATPWRVSATAEVHAHLNQLADGRLLMTWSNYHLPYGVAAAISSDGGRTWDRDRIVRLAVSADCYTGWAATVQLDDGSLVTVYATTIYASEKDRPKSACEVVRWRLP